MRIDKEKALELRREGKSYAQITAVLGVQKGTLSKWFSSMEWSEGLRQKLVRDGKEPARARMMGLNKVRGERLAEVYKKAQKEAVAELAGLQYDPLFVAGLMLYWADGDQGLNTPIRLSTANLEKGKFFLEFLVQTCGVPKEKVRASLMVYPGQDEQSNKRFWAFALGGGVSFTKSSVVSGRFDARKLQYGICTFTVSSKYLKIKMLEWLKILPKRLIER